MRSFDKERNAQTLTDENQRQQETFYSFELQKQNERYIDQEMLTNNKSDEINESSNATSLNGKNRKSQGLSAKQLTQYLASVTVVITATATVIVPVVSTINNANPIIEIVSEAVGALSYKCAVDLNGEEIELDALLLNSAGEEVVRQEDISIKKGEQASLDFQHLQPQTLYELNMVDDNGEVRLEREFITNPFVTFTESADIIKLNFDQDVLSIEELGIEFLAKNGNDFSSNLLHDEFGKVTLYKKGLYSGEYRLITRCFLIDGVKEFSMPLTLGELTGLNYDATLTNYGEIADIKHELTLTYLLGDILPYTISEVTIYSDDYEVYHSFYGEELVINENSVGIPIYEIIPSGEYNVCIWGELVEEDMSYYNQIWLGKIVI